MNQTLSGILTVVIIDGKEIRFNTFLGNPSPYVILKVGQVKYQTEICEKQEQPIWNCRFAIDLSKFQENDEIVFELYDYNPYISDTLVSQWTDTIKNVIQTQKALRMLELVQPDKKRAKNGKIKVSFEYYNNQLNTVQDKELNQELIGSQNAEGVLRINLLNGTKIKRSKDTIFGSVHIFTINQSTKRFKQDNPTINHKFFMNCQPLKEGNLEIQYQLKNYFGSSDLEVDVGQIKQNFDQLSLVQNKPKCIQQNFMDNNIPNTAALMCEYTFLKNAYTRNPKGIIKMRIERVENLNLKKAFYTFQNGNELAKFYIEGPNFYLETSSVLDDIRFNLYANKDLMEIEMNKEAFSQLDPDCTVSLIFSELHWEQSSTDEVERDASTTLSFVTNKVATKVTLSFIHRNEVKWSKVQKEVDPLVANFKRQQTLQINEKTPLNTKSKDLQKAGNSQFAKDQSRQSKIGRQSQADMSSLKTIQNMVQDDNAHTFNKLSTKVMEEGYSQTGKKIQQAFYDGQNFFTTIKSLSISGINFDDLGKVNLYLEVSNPALNYRTFSSVCDNLYKYDWQTNIPVSLQNYLEKDAVPISVKLYDLYVNQNQVEGEVIPQKYNEMLTFIINPIKLESPPVLLQQVGEYNIPETSVEIKEVNVNTNFLRFYKKILSQKNKTLEEFQNNLSKNASLNVTYTQNKSIFVDKPLGILMIDCIQGENVQYTNRDILNSLFVFEVNNQIVKTDEQINNPKNPKFSKAMKLFTTSITDVLKIKLFDYSSNTSLLMFEIDYKIAELPLINSDSPNTWKITLSSLNQEIEGNFILTLSYTPITAHPFYKQMESGIEFNEKTFWVERYEKRDASAQSQTQLKISLKSFELSKGKRDTHAQVTIKSKDSTYITQRIRLNTTSVTYSNIQENFRLNLNPFDLEDQTLELSCTLYNSKDNKNFTINNILNGQFEWTKYPLKKHKLNYIQIELKKVNLRGQQNESKNQITLKVDLLDSLSIQNLENVLLNIRPLQLNNINYSLPLNDPFFKTSCQYVLKMYVNQKDQINQFYYAMPGTVESISDQKNVYFIPSSVTFFKSPFRATSLQKMIIQNISSTTNDRQMNFGERVCSFFSNNKNQIIHVELVQITDMTVKHPSNIDFKTLDLYSIPTLKGHFYMTDICNVLNEQDQSLNFAVKMQKQNHPNLINASESNMNQLGTKQEEIVLVFSADFRICPKRITEQSEESIQKDEAEQQKQEQSGEQQLVQEMKDGIINIQVDGLRGINYSVSQSKMNKDTEASVYSNQIIFKQLDQESLTKQSQGKKNSYANPQDEVSEFYRNDEAPFHQSAQIIYHPSQINIPVSVIKNVIEFLNFDKSKRFIKRKQLESFVLNLDSVQWFTDQTLSMSVLLQNDALYRSAVLNLNLTFIQNKFTQNHDCSLILKSFEIKDIKQKDFLNTLYFSLYIQGYDQDEDINQKFVCHSNNSYPLLKDEKKFKQSQVDSRTLQASEFQQTETGYSYNSGVTFKCGNIFDALVIDLCDSAKSSTGILSKYKIALYNIKFPNQPDDKKEGGQENQQEEQQDEENEQEDNKVSSLSHLNEKRRMFKENQIKTIIEHGLKKINDENNQKKIEVEFFLVLYNTMNIIKRIPCKITLEQVIGEVTEQQNKTLSLMNVAKIKGKLTSIREKLYKIFYYDSKMNAYEFNQQFRKKFKGMNLMYLRQRFQGMTSIYNNPEFKKQLPQYAKNNNYLWHFTIPQGTSLQIKGSLKLKYSFNIGLIVKSGNKSQSSEKFTAQFKRDVYSYREERGGDGEEIEMTEITFNHEIDFYIPDHIINQGTQVCLFLKYMDKDGHVKTEEGELSRTAMQNIQQSIKSPDDLFQTQSLLTFIRPSNFRVIVLIRVITSAFHQQSVGELQVQIHKIIRVDQAEIEDVRGLNSTIRYENKKIVSKRLIDKISVFALSLMKLKVKVNGQKEFTNFIDADGCIIQNEFKTHKFLTSHTNDKIELKLIMTGQSKEQLNKFMRNINEDNNEEMEEAKQKDEEGEEDVEQENNDDFLKEDRSINLCKGNFYIVDSVYSKPSDEEFFFMQPLSEMIYHNNDVMKQFYNILNRQNLYVLGSFKFNPIHWAKVFMKIDGVKNINLNPEHHLIKQIIQKVDEDHTRYKDDLIYFGLKLKTMIYYADYSADVLHEHSTSLIEVTLNTLTQSFVDAKPLSFQFDTPENFSIVYKQSEEVENIAIEIKLIMMYEGIENELCQRLYPVKKMCDTKYLNTVMSLNLELNEQCQQLQFVNNDDLINFKNEKSIPVINSRIQAKQEMKIKRNQNEFDKLVIEKKEKLQNENEKLNFRKTTLLEMISNLLNSTQRKVIIQIIKEIQELILYLDYSEYKMYFKLTLLTLLNFVRVYYDDYEIAQQCLVNICNLSSQDLLQFTALFKISDGISIINELAEMISKIKLLHINQIGAQKDEQKLVSAPSSSISKKKQPSLMTSYKTMKQNPSTQILSTDQLKEDKYDFDTLFKIILNNRLKYLDAQRDERGMLLKNIHFISSQKDFELLEFSQKDEYLKSKGVQSMQLLKLVDFYVARQAESVIECIDLFKVIDVLLADNLGKVKNMVSLYTMIATKILSMTINEDNEKLLGLDIFVNFLNAICNSSSDMGADDTLIALKTACKLFSYLSYKQDFAYIGKTYHQYFSFVFSLVGTKRITRYVLSDVMDSLVKDITVISTDPEKTIKKKFAQLVDEKNLLRQIEKVLDEELLDSFVLAENEKELFNEDIIIENAFKFLTILAKEFNYPQVEFDGIESTLRQRQKTVKKPKRKATIENFLNFLFNKGQGLQDLNKYDITKRKQELLKKKKEDLINDPLKLKNELATKYLISKLDWK